MRYVDVVKNWERFANAITNLGGKVRSLSIARPAKIDEVDAVEKELGFSIPLSLRDAFLNFASMVDFRWFFPDGYEIKGDLSEIFCGEMCWSLESISQVNKSKNEWLENCFSNQNDPYDAVWHNKLAFQEIGNGDFLAIDLKRLGHEPIVYLSHDDGDGHGIELAENFKEYLFITSRIGCVGCEDWQILPFIDEGAPYIKADSDNAKMLRKILGVQL